MKDGPDHLSLRRSFPTEFMIYEMTKKMNYEYLCESVDKLIAIALKKSNIIDIKEQISNPLAINFLTKLYGLKNCSKELEDKLILWSERHSDTGMRHDLIENSDYYQEAHDFFLKTI